MPRREKGDPPKGLEEEITELSDREQMLQDQIDELRADLGKLEIALSKLGDTTEAFGNDVADRVTAIEAVPILATSLRMVHASQ